MLKFNPKEFIFIFTQFSDLSRQLEAIPNLNKLLPLEVKNKIIPALNETELHCSTIGLDLSIILIDQIRKAMEKDYSAISLKKSLDELKSRILDEIDSPLLLGIKRNKVHYFENSIPFAQDVFDKFPSATFDIEEASKCFALARYTACVMHLQRVMEIGLKAFASTLGVWNKVKSEKPNWGRILTPIRDEIGERNGEKKKKENMIIIPCNKWNSQEEKEFCNGVRPFLEAVRTAWRNPSMHVGRKYTEEEAEDIFNAAKGFMRYLSEHLDETGNFTP